MLIKKIGPALLLVVLVAVAVAAPKPLRADVSDGSRIGGVLNWSGNVDDTIIVYVHRHDVRIETINGKNPSNVSMQFNGRVRERRGYVHLRTWNGRGDVQIVQQPTPANDFTAAVRIFDPQPSAGYYTFTLVYRQLPPFDDDDGLQPWQH